MSWTERVAVVLEQRLTIDQLERIRAKSSRVKIRAMLFKEVISLEDLWHDTSAVSQKDQKGQDGHQMESVGLIRSSSIISSCSYFAIFSSYRVLQFHFNFPKFCAGWAPFIVALLPKLCIVEAKIATPFEQNFNKD